MSIFASHHAPSTCFPPEFHVRSRHEANTHRKHVKEAVIIVQAGVNACVEGYRIMKVLVKKRSKENCELLRSPVKNDPEYNSRVRAKTS